MRFMVMIRANEMSEAEGVPDEKLIREMGRFNEELIQAGVMVAGEGLQPSAKGARVKFTRGKVIVTDGPFTETKELIAGFWILQVKSKQEAIEWMKRCPAPFGPDVEAEVELRQVFEASDFGPEVEKEELAQRQRMAEQHGRKS